MCFLTLLRENFEDEINVSYVFSTANFAKILLIECDLNIRDIL